MQELKRSKSKKSTDLDQKNSRKSIESDNLHVPLTPSIFRSIKSSSRPSTAKSRGRVDRRRSVADREPPVRMSQAPPSEVPENVAVHFASFYQNQNPSLPHSCAEDKRSGGRRTPICNSPKMEFTRQMVYKLENSAGTQNYGREVSALLDETVESPGFDLKLPPIDNCSPNKKSGDYYPLWYRDPNKMPQISRNHFRELKHRYTTEKNKLCEEIRKAEESINSDSSDTEVELELEFELELETETEEDDEDEESLNWETESDEEDEVVALDTRRNTNKRISAIL